MTKQDLFEAALLEAQLNRKDDPKVMIDCDHVHPIVAEYMIETMDKIEQAEKHSDPELAGINAVVGDLVRQASACLTEEIFGLFYESLEGAKDLAMDVLIDLATGNEEDDLEDLENPDDELLLISMGSLEVIVKTALKIGYMVIPEVEKHFE